MALESASFDIMPLRSRLEPALEVVAEVTYYAVPGQRGAALAVCHVEGGPTYRFPVSAESSSIK